MSIDYCNRGLRALLLVGLCGQSGWAQEAGMAPEPAEAPAPLLLSDPTPQSEPLRSLDEVVITATRSPVRLFEAPYTAEVITADQINERLYRTTPEALRDVPGVMVQKTSHGQGSPFIRGFTGFRNLFLIDGIRLNNSTFREGPNQYWSTVNPLTVQRYELVKGPSSVLYGSDAIGGTVNAITKTPTGYGEGSGHAGRAYYRGSTAERSSTIHGELSLTADRTLGAFIAGSGKWFGDLQGGADTGRLENTGYDEADADFKTEYFFNPDTRLVFAYQFVQQNNVPRTHSTIDAVPFAGSTVGTDLRRDLDQTRELVYVQFYAEQIEGFIDTMRLSLSYHRQDEVQDRIRGDRSRTVSGVDVNTLGFWAQFESPSPVGRWTYGIEFYRDWVNSFSTGNEIQGPVGDDSTYDLFGVFVQNQIELTERLDLTLGGRYTFAAAEAGSVSDPVTGLPIRIEDEWDSLVGSARVSFEIIPDHWRVFGGISQGFRAPNLSDLTRLDSALSGEIETPSPDLEPEEFLAFEAGVKADYDNFALQAAYFYTDIDSIITRVPTGNIINGESEITKRNGGEGFIQGVEAGASWRFHPEFTLFGNITWMEGETEQFPTSAPVSVTAPADRIMPLTGQIGLRWQPDRKLWVEGVLVVADEQDKLSFLNRNDTQRIPPGGTPGYEVLSLRGGYNFHRNASLTVALENILDEDYRIHGSGTNEPGINLIVGLDVRF